MNNDLSGKTILIVCPTKIIPIVGGALARFWQMIDYMRKTGFRVEVITVPHEEEISERIARMVDRVWMLEKKVPVAGKRNNQSENDRMTDTYLSFYSLKKAMTILKRKIKAILWRIPFDNKIFRRVGKVEEIRKDMPDRRPKSMLERRRNRQLEEYAGEVVSRCHPVAAIAVYAWTAHVLDRMPPGVLKILDTIDVQHTRAKIASAAGGDMSNCVCTQEEERKELSRADVLLAIQSNEMAIFKEMCPDKSVLLVGHAPPISKNPPVSADSMDILFIGNQYDPNIRGVCQFLESVWPKIKSAIPESRFIVCGLVCETLPPAPQAVKYEGIVPALNPYYNSAAVVINPVPYGTGLPIKTVEALARGKCVVTTPAGSLHFSDEKNCPFIVVSIESMAEKIIELLQDSQKRQTFEQAAWEFARQRFAPENVFAELVNVLEHHTKAGVIRYSRTPPRSLKRIKKHLQNTPLRSFTFRRKNRDCT